MTVATTRPPVVARGARLSKREAEAITHRIRASAAHLWLLVCDAHDRKAWLALGYPSWREYVTSELRMSESRSYQLVDTGHVVRVAQQVLGIDSSALELAPTMRETAKAKANLSALKRELRARAREGLEPPEAWRAAVRALPAPVPTQRKPADAPQPRPARRIPKGSKVCPRCDGLGYV